MKSLTLFLATAVALSASTFNFDISPNPQSTVQGDVTGTITLASSCNPCSASDIAFNAVPAGITLTGDPTSWNVIANNFVVTNGAITSLLFFAVGNTMGDGSIDVFCLSNEVGPNNTLINPTYKGFQCPSYTAEALQWEPTTMNRDVFNLAGIGGIGITFGPQFPMGGGGSAPEPREWTLLGIGLAVWAVWKSRRVRVVYSPLHNTGHPYLLSSNSDPAPITG